MFRPSTRMNVAFINITSYNILQQQPAPTPRHTIFAFLISTLFNFLELQYQNTSNASPFQTHPKTMWVALFSMLLYCVAYEVEPRFTQVGRGVMGLFGRCCAVELKCFGAGSISKLLPIFLKQYSQSTGGGSQLPSLPIGEAFSHWLYKIEEATARHSQSEESSAAFSQASSLLFLVDCSMMGFPVSWALLARLRSDPASDN
ncbi:hypothetical protein Vadar_034282 [Vaccinium darrowii]|uniref:Uncharacterized protein n=1 Tax=Vaccinium darrowii TaxID=229202 RepID=A0ACB7ZGD8_9ERIC|nr:hypothetical protein Vadar_034282 [Vaccinium darrowii]